MYQQISLDGRDCVCDFRFRILSSQHRNAKFVLRFWLVRIQSGEPVKGLEVKVSGGKWIAAWAPLG